MDRLFFVLGSISGFLAVAVGAFGAHLLRDRIPPELMHTFETAHRQHMLHVVALLAMTGQRWLGAVTPFGGLALLLGWLALAWRAWAA